MIEKRVLEQLSSLNIELDNIEKRLEEIETKPRKIVQDSVQGSSSEYPYTSHTMKVEGIEEQRYNLRKKVLKKQYRSKIKRIKKLLKNVEYELNYIKDSEIREIIRMRYEENLSWIQIQIRMNYNSEEKARIKLKRFFEKN